MICRKGIQKILRIAQQWAGRIPAIQPFLDKGAAWTSADVHEMMAVVMSTLSSPDAETRLRAQEFLSSLGSNTLREWASETASDPHYQENLTRWFGRSKVVDTGGQPLVVYHGTEAKVDFRSFRPNFDKTMQFGFGVHFAVDPRLSSEFYAKHPERGRVIPAYLRIENPLDADVLCQEGSSEWDLAMKLLKHTRRQIYISTHPDTGKKCLSLRTAVSVIDPKAAQKEIQAAGYDGVKYKAVIYDGSPHGIGSASVVGEFDCFVAFEPKQVKAVFNQGPFADDQDEFDR